MAPDTMWHGEVDTRLELFSRAWPSPGHVMLETEGSVSLIIRYILVCLQRGSYLHTLLATCTTANHSDVINIYPEAVL